MSLIREHVASNATREVDPGSWTPEISDLQKYRDSLKVMADRVSQAEDMWTKSLEPSQDLPLSPTLQSRRPRRLSKGNRPLPLQRPVATTKRIRNQDGIRSPVPFQLRSPVDVSDDALSSQMAVSATTSPVQSPLYRGAARGVKRIAEDKRCNAQPPGLSAQRILKQAELLLSDAIQFARKATPQPEKSSKRSSPKQGDGNASMIAKARSASKQMRITGRRVQTLIVDAQRKYKLSLADEVLVNPLDNDDVLAMTDSQSEILQLLCARARGWSRAILRAQEGMTDDEAESPSSPSSSDSDR